MILFTAVSIYITNEAVQTTASRITFAMHLYITRRIGDSRYLSFPDNTSLRLRCSTCAYVTGSGHMLGSGKGSEIDSMSCVIRSNDAPTRGYEKDVGTKTTVRTVDHASLRVVTARIRRAGGAFDPSVLNTTIVLASSDPLQRLWNRMKDARKVDPRMRLYWITTQRYHEITGAFYENVSPKGVWPSNGFTSIYFARDICDDIHVYGINDESFCDQALDANSSVQDVPYHYYVKGRKNCRTITVLDKQKKNTHHLTKEKRFYKKLIKQWGNLYFHAPEWAENPA